MNDGGPAFPSTREVRVGELVTNGHAGMTLRDYFAGQALTGLLTLDPRDPAGNAPLAAGAAYEVADAMLAERDK